MSVTSNSLVKVSRVQRGENGALLGVTTVEVSPAEAARLEAEQLLVAKKEERKRIAHAEAERLQLEENAERNRLTREAEFERRLRQAEVQRRAREAQMARVAVERRAIKLAVGTLRLVKLQQNRMNYERHRNWLERQIEVTFAAAEGRSANAEPSSLSEQRELNAHERNLASIVTHRIKFALEKETGRSTGPDFWRNISAGRDGNLTRSIVGFVDARIGLEMVKLKYRPATMERSSRPVQLNSYRFVWESGEKYLRGEVVTDKGASWICLTPSSARPGKSPDWRLMDKSDIGNRQGAR